MADSDILKGARLAAAARELGMSEDELFEYIGKKTQSANRRTGGNRSQQEGVEQFLSKFDASQSAVAGIPREISGKRSVSNDFIQSGEFGNQDELQNFGGVDDKGRTRNVEAALSEREKLRSKADSNIARQRIKRRDGAGYDVEEVYIPDGVATPDRFRESMMARDFGLFGDRVAPSSVALDAADRVQQSIDLGMAESGAEDVVTRLQDSVFGNPAADQALVRDMIRRDRYGMPEDEISNAVRLEFNRRFEDTKRPAGVTDADVKNALEAEIRARRVSPEAASETLLVNKLLEERAIRNAVGGSGDALDQIGNIGKIGHAKYAQDFAVSAPVPGRETEPTSLPINTPELLNAPQTDNRFVGPLQRGEQWLEDTAPGYREGSGVFKDYPQVAIDKELGNVEQAIRDVRMRKQGIAGAEGVRIRGINDLQNALDQVVGLASETGTPLFHIEGGQRVTPENPGMREALTKLGLNQNSQTNLANALVQVEAGRHREVNRLRNKMFELGLPMETNRPIVGGGNHESLGGGDLGIQRLGRETVNIGTKEEPMKREVKSQLQALQGVVGNPGEPLTDSELRDARSPFQAGTEDRPVKRAQFISGEARKMTPEQRVAAFGPANAAIANRVEQRYLESEAKRPMATSSVVNPNTQSAPLEVRSGWVGTPTGSASTANGQVEGPRITDAIRNQLADLNSGATQGPSRAPQQGPRMGEPRQRSMGERVAYATNKIKGYATSPRFTRGRRTGYVAGGAGAAIAGLDALIGNEQEKRQEEAMYS